MENTILLNKKSERDNAFRNLMKSQKCPFRLHTVSSSNETYQYMMPCDPDCVALIHASDKSSYSCLRLTHSIYEIPKGHGIEIFGGIEKDENES